MLDQQAASRLEQRTLTISIYGVVLVAVGSLACGLFLESDVVILNGIFSLRYPAPTAVARSSSGGFAIQESKNLVS